jgi:hypothetical protein
MRCFDDNSKRSCRKTLVRGHNPPISGLEHDPYGKEDCLDKSVGGGSVWVDLAHEQWGKNEFFLLITVTFLPVHRQ